MGCVKFTPTQIERMLLTQDKKEAEKFVQFLCGEFVVETTFSKPGDEYRVQVSGFRDLDSAINASDDGLGFTSTDYLECFRSLGIRACDAALMLKFMVENPALAFQLDNAKPRKNSLKKLVRRVVIGNASELTQFEGYEFSLDQSKEYRHEARALIKDKFWEDLAHELVKCVAEIHEKFIENSVEEGGLEEVIAGFLNEHYHISVNGDSALVRILLKYDDAFLEIKDVEQYETFERELSCSLKEDGFIDDLLQSFECEAEDASVKRSIAEYLGIEAVEEVGEETLGNIPNFDGIVSAASCAKKIQQQL